MLEYTSISTLGGIVLWSRRFAPLSGQPINQLLQNVLIESQSETSYDIGNYTVQYKLDKTLQLMFTVVSNITSCQIVYQKAYRPPYSDSLLNLLHKTFIAEYNNKDYLAHLDNMDGFTSKFNTLLKSLQEKANAKV